MYRRRPYFKCYFCGKYSKNIVLAYIDGAERYVCTRCFLSYILHEAIKEMLKYGDEEDLKHVVRVLEGINDLVEDNPLAQSIRFVIDEWAQKYPKPLYIDELERKWGYKFKLDKILEYLSSEEILTKSKFLGSDRLILSPGNMLRNLLRRFPSSKGFFRDIVKAVTGLAVVRYLADPKTRKFRMIYATLQALAACIDDPDSEPYYEVKGYRCRICNNAFSSKTEIKLHILKQHPYEINCDIDDNECFLKYVSEITGRQLGIWCKHRLFIEKASVYGVRAINRYFRYLLTKGAIIPVEGEEIVVERKGDKYIAADIAWGRVRERMKQLERQVIRGRRVI